MTTFLDNAGRSWSLTITVDTIRRVRSLLGIDLLAVLDGDLLTRLAVDPVLLTDVLYACCRPEAETRGISDEEFGRSMAGDAIDGATTALLQELINFFPRARRTVLAATARKLDELQARVMSLAMARLETLDPTTIAEQALQSSVGGASSSVLGSAK